MLASVLVPQATNQPAHLGIFLAREIASLLEAHWGDALSGSMAPVISLSDRNSERLRDFWLATSVHGHPQVIEVGTRKFSTVIPVN